MWTARESRDSMDREGVEQKLFLSTLAVYCYYETIFQNHNKCMMLYNYNHKINSYSVRE